MGVILVQFANFHNSCFVKAVHTIIFDSFRINFLLLPVLADLFLIYTQLPYLSKLLHNIIFL